MSNDIIIYSTEDGELNEDSTVNYKLTVQK